MTGREALAPDHPAERLTVKSDGTVSGPANISYNSPFPCVNGSWGSGAMQGVVMHTMVGNLPGTITVFNDPSYQASTHFGIDQQATSISSARSARAGSPGRRSPATWRGTRSSTPTAATRRTRSPDAQITASAQLVEMLSAFAGFPLQVTDSVSGKGYGAHVMGGAAWGGHTCPGPEPRVRTAGRPSSTLAKQIR